MKTIILRTLIILSLIITSKAQAQVIGCQAAFNAVVDSTGYGVQFTNTSTGNFTNVQWTFGDGNSSTAANPFHAYNANGSITACLTIWDTNGSGCQSMICDTLTIGTPVGSGCAVSFGYQASGTTIYFNASSGGVFGNGTYTWDFGDGNVGTGLAPHNTYAQAGTYNVCVILTTLSGCSDTACQSVVVSTSAPCQSSFSWQNTGGTFYFYGYSNSPAGGITFDWDFGDGTQGTGQYPTHNYSTPGTYNVCLTITSANGCVDTYCHNVTVAGPPPCSATFTSHPTGGALNITQFNSTYNANTGIYTWDFGDGTTGTGPNPIHSYQSVGTYYVCLDVADSIHNCYATFCDSVTVGNNTSVCQALFSFQQLPASNLMVQFSDNSIGNVTSWLWNFGDGHTSAMQNPIHTYAQAGVYNVCLTIGDPMLGCSGVFCANVTFGSSATCNAQFFYSNQNASFQFVSNNNSYSHHWTFGDGTSSFAANPSHTYGSTGTYVVCHTVYDSMQTCSDTWCDTVTFNTGNPCNASFTYGVDSSGYTYTFSNTSTGGLLATITWSFGDGTGSNIANPVHQYTTQGNYVVCLTISTPNGILCSFCDSISVGNPASGCTPVFYTYPDSNVIGNGNVHFGVFNPCGNTQYVWDFGDNHSGSGANPLHNYADSGWYYVCVTAFTSGGNFTYCDSVYAFRLTSAISENELSIGLHVFPNPISGAGTAKFQLAGNAHVIAEIYDMQGRIKSSVLNETLNSGTHSVDINANNLQNGIYILQFNIDNVIIHQRISVVN